MCACSLVSDSLWSTDCSLPGSSVHGIFKTRILEQVAISFSKRSFPTQGSSTHLLRLLHCMQILYQVLLVIKNPLANAGDMESLVWPLGMEDPLQDSKATDSSILAWKVSVDRGASRATVHRVTESDTTEAT